MWQRLTRAYSQFGEPLQPGEIIYTSDVVVLHKQMGEVGGKPEVGNVGDVIIIQVQDSEASAQREVTLEIEWKHKAREQKERTE